MRKVDNYIPSEVVNFVLDNDVSALAGWRNYLELTQSEVAERMGISQPAYAQLEAKKSISKASRKKVAAALGILEEQLDF